MNAWGIFLLLIGGMIVLIGITGRAPAVLNGVRAKTGNPPKVY